MGLLVDGKWADKWYDTSSTDGAFKREASKFRGWLGSDEFPAEANRYHLYVSLACPWAHRVLIIRALKNLESLIDVSVVDSHMGQYGWTFGQESSEHLDRLYQSDYMWQIYTRAKPDYTGRVTVPVLWDKKNETIVNNESAELLRMLNTAFNTFDGVDAELDWYPKPLRSEIDAVNDLVYSGINNGVYRAGFATTQASYNSAVEELFFALDKMEKRLESSDFLVGSQKTEADWRLFTTLIRFDAVYHGHFKCNLKRLIDYPRLRDYTERLYNTEKISETVNFSHIKSHYYGSHATINPTGIVPVGPAKLF